MFNFGRSASTGSAPPTSAPQSGGFSFGGPTAAHAAAAAAPATGGFSFGGSTAAPAAAPAAGAFSFGGSTATQTAGQQPATSSFSLGGFGAAQPQAQVQAPPQAATMDSFPGLTRIMELQLAYAPYVDNSGNPLSALPSSVPTAQQMNQPIVLINKNCEFEYVFYDLIQVNASSGALVRKPKPSCISQRQWDRVNEMENPNPEKYEPTIIRGIQELKSRFELQSENTTKLAAYLEEIKNATGVLESSLSQVVTRISELKRTHEKLTIKLLDIIGKIEVLRCRTVPLRASEVKYREKLENVLVVLTQKHHQLVELMNAEKRVPRALQAQSRAKNNIIFEDTHATTAEELCVIYQSLKQQREGLQQLTDMLRKDARDIAIIERSTNI